MNATVLRAARVNRALQRCNRLPVRHFHACVVGAGPAGLYSAGELLRAGASRVDVLDARPGP